MNIVAIKDCSAGNDTVGEMWQETKIFDGETPAWKIIAWAKDRCKRLTLTLPDDGTDFPKDN